LAAIRLDWRQTGSGQVSRTFRSILRDAEAARREVDRLSTARSSLAQPIRINVGDSERQLAGLNGRAQQLRQTLSQVGDRRIRVQADTAGLDRLTTSQQSAASGFREFSQSVAGTGQQLTAVQRRLQSYQQQNLQLANSINVPVGAIRQLNTQLGTLPPTTARVVARYGELRGAGESSVRTFQQLNTEFGISRGQFQGLQATIGLSTQELTALSLAAGAVATAIGSIFQGGASNFVEFERSIQGAAIRAGATREEFSGVADEAKRLGAETALTAPQVAAAADQLSRIGFSATDSENALDGLVRTTISSGEDLNTVTQTVASALRQFNLGTEETTRVGDLLSTAANRSNVSISSLGQSLRLAAPQARAAGQSIEETVLALSLLGDNALRGGIGGRNLARALEVLSQASAASTSELAELSNGNQKAIGALQRLGTTTRDEAGNFLPLFDVLGQLTKELDTLGQADQEVLLSALGGGVQGGRALGTLISTLRDAPDAVSDLRGELENATAIADIAAEQFREGLPGAVNQIQSAFEGLQIRFFAEFAEEAESVVRTATGLIQTFLGLPQPIQSALIGTVALTGVLASAIAVISGYQLAIQTLGISNLSLSRSAIAAGVAQRVQSAGLAANTAAANLNSVSQINVGRAVATMATAFGRSTTSIVAQTGALRTNAATAATGFAATLRGIRLNAAGLANLRTAVIGNPFFQAGVYAGVAASIALVANELNAVTEAARATEESTNRVQESLAKVAAARQQASEAGSEERLLAVQEELAVNTQAAAAEFNVFTRALDSFRVAINSIGLNSLADQLINLLPIPDAVKNALSGLTDFLPTLTTATEASANRQQVAFGELIKATEDGVRSAEQSLSGNADISVLESQRAAIQAATEELNNQAPATEQAIGVRNAYLKILRDTDAQLQAGIEAQRDSANALDETTESVESQASAFDELFKATEASLAETSASELSARADLEERKAELIRSSSSKQAIDEANAAILASETQFNTDRIQQLEVAQARLSELSAADPEAAAGSAKEIADIDKQLNELRISQAENLTAQFEAQEEARLETLNRSFDEQRRTIEGNDQQRQIQRIELQTQLVGEGASDQRVQVEVDLAGAEDARRRIGELVSLEEDRRDAFQEGSEDRIEAETALRDLAVESAQNQLELVQARQSAEIAAIEQVRSAQVSAIETEQAIRAALATQQETAASQGLNAISEATTAIGRQNTALSRQNAILDARNSLQGVVDTSEVTGLERALAIRRQLSDDTEESASVRKALERELAGIVGTRNASETRIQRELLEAQERRAENQRRALVQSQALERVSLETEIRRQGLALQRQAIEQQIAIIQSQASAAQLEGERQKLAAERTALQAELAGTQDAQARAALQGQLDANNARQQGISAQSGALQQERALREQALEVTTREQQNLGAVADQQRQQLSLAQQQAQVEQLSTQAAEARATATDLAESGSRRLASSANRAALEIERQRDAAVELAEALLRASSLTGGATGVNIPGFRTGTDAAGAPGGLSMVGEAGAEMRVLPRGTQIFSHTQSKEIARQAIRVNPSIIERLGVTVPAASVTSPAVAVASPDIQLDERQLSMGQVESLLGNVVTSNEKILNELQRNSKNASRKNALDDMRRYKK